MGIPVGVPSFTNSGRQRLGKTFGVCDAEALVGKKHQRERLVMSSRLQMENFPFALLGGLGAASQECFDFLAIKFSVRNCELARCRSVV